MSYYGYNVIVIGAGGTGGYFLSMLGAYVQKTKCDCKVIIVDGDRVEKHNLDRQAFRYDDVGKSKAEIFQKKLTTVYKIDCRYSDQDIRSAVDIEQWVDSKRMTILIGCVDNHKCRQHMHYFFENQHSCYYLDSGNEYSYGEVVAGVRLVGRTIHSPRAVFFPEVLTSSDDRDEADSCEAINIHEPQHIVTNMTAANTLLIMLNSILYPKFDAISGIRAFNIEDCTVAQMVK